MPYQIFRTTAEEIIGATDAVLQFGNGTGEQVIADFLQTSVQNAQNAGLMAVELGLLTYDAGNSTFSSKFPFATYLVTSNSQQKAAVLRLVLEEYRPYKAFKARLMVTNTSGEAANQIKAILGLAADRTDINETFISLGTFTNSLISEGAGKFLPLVSDDYAFLSVADSVVEQRQEAELKIRERLGEEIYQWIDTQDVFEQLVTAFQGAGQAEVDPRSPVLHAGNAIESFLVQIGTHYGVNLVGANGVNAKIDRITQAGHLSTKHKNMCKYLGHIRNACDHGVDAEIGQAWTISSNTSVEFVNVALTFVRSAYDAIHGNFII